MKHKSILLVDDDADDQLIFIDAVKEIFSDVVCLLANNGREAYLKLEKSLPPKARTKGGLSGRGRGKNVRPGRFAKR